MYQTDIKLSDLSWVFPSLLNLVVALGKDHVMVNG